MAKKGQEGFEDFFREYYGTRWDDLKSALVANDMKTLRKNIWVDFSIPNGLEQLSWLKGCFVKNSSYDDSFDRKVDENGLRYFYPMDPASVIVARSLSITDEATVLDMCAAPGGKTLILFETMKGKGGLFCNEVSRNRRERLKSVIRDYIPDHLREAITVKGIDGLQYGLQMKDHFDAILVDAPCSGEKHIIQAPSEVEKWSEKRTKRLAGLQFGLVCSALLALKSGGEMVYSTCSISPFENDGVLEKLEKKKGDHFQFLPLEGEMYEKGERTKYGVLFLPDKCGFGPLFVSRIQKIN